MLRFLWHVTAFVLVVVGLVLLIKMWILPALFLIVLGGGMWSADMICD